MLRPQYKVGAYRIDFAIIQKPIKIAIELDGFAYHDRDKEQFQRERKRQNFITSQGFKILRYTWSDVCDRFEDVYDEINELLLDAHFKEEMS
jgi:very-short-patch-repair endonuclease